MNELTRLLVKRASKSGPQTELDEHGKTIKKYLGEASDRKVKPTEVARGISSDHGKEIADKTGVSEQRGEQVYYQALPHFEELLKFIATVDPAMVKQAVLVSDKDGYKLVSRKDPKKVLRHASMRSRALTEVRSVKELDERTYRKAMLRLAQLMPVGDLAHSIISNLTSKLKPAELTPSEQLKKLVEQQLMKQPDSYNVFKILYPSIAAPLINIV